MELCDSEVVAGVAAIVLCRFVEDHVLGGGVHHFLHNHHRRRKHQHQMLLPWPLVGWMVDWRVVLSPIRCYLCFRCYSCLLLRRWGDSVGCFEGAEGAEGDRGD